MFTEFELCTNCACMSEQIYVCCGNNIIYNQSFVVVVVILSEMTSNSSCKNAERH